MGHEYLLNGAYASCETRRSCVANTDTSKTASRVLLSTSGWNKNGIFLGYSLWINNVPVFFFLITGTFFTQHENTKIYAHGTNTLAYPSASCR